MCTVFLCRGDALLLSPSKQLPNAETLMSNQTSSHRSATEFAVGSELDRVPLWSRNYFEFPPGNHLEMPRTWIEPTGQVRNQIWKQQFQDSTLICFVFLYSVFEGKGLTRKKNGRLIRISNEFCRPNIGLDRFMEFIIVVIVSSTK